MSEEVYSFLHSSLVHSRCESLLVSELEVGGVGSKTILVMLQLCASE